MNNKNPSAKAQKSPKGILGAGLLTAFAASLCCITPVLALFSGVTGIASTFSWIEPFRPYLIGLTIAVLAFAWYQKLKPKKEGKEGIDCGCEVDDKPSFWQSKKFLGIVTILAFLLMAFPAYSKIFFPKTPATQVVVVDKNNLRQVKLKITGMDCAMCTNAIHKRLSQTNGIIKDGISYSDGSAIITYDPAKITVKKIIKIIKGEGYKATIVKEINTKKA